MRVERVRTVIAERFPEAIPRPPLPAPVLSFGIPEVDSLLPSGGLCRGRIAEIVGEPGSGRTSLVKSLVREMSGAIAIVDPDRSLAPWDFTGLSSLIWMVRGDAHYSADVLLRSKSFDLVVLFDARPRSSSAPLVRLQRLAEESASVCLFVGKTSQGASLVTTRLTTKGGEFTFEGLPSVLRGRTVVVRLEKGGPHASTEVVFREEETDRLLSHPEAPDRAAVAWRGAGGRRATPRFA